MSDLRRQQSLLAIMPDLRHQPVFTRCMCPTSDINQSLVAVCTQALLFGRK